MKHSLSFYLTLLIIKLKGIKKNFSVASLDIKKIRGEDIHAPKGTFFNNNNIRRFSVANTLITEFRQPQDSAKLLIFVHGGAFISGPSQLHWEAIRKIYQASNHTIWMCDYPKSPESDITKISMNMDSVYTAALANYEARNITLLGDSVGGTLITALTQRILQRKQNIPHKLLLVCPVFDATFSNPAIEAVERTDVMLSKVGVVSAKRMCAGTISLSDEMISPLNGCFEQFPTTILFLAENDITYPDQQLAVNKMRAYNVPIKTIIGEGMPHIWPYLPVMNEAKTAFAKLLKAINN